MSRKVDETIGTSSSSQQDVATYSQPPTKPKKTLFEQANLGPVATLEEMDKKVLSFQNQKLQQRLEQKKRVEAELKSRIDQLEKRQTNDDAVLSIVNRHWNQLNEDIRILLQRFDAEIADEKEDRESTASFLNELSSWNNEELDEKLIQRVDFTKRIIGKLLQAFDRLSQRQTDLTNLMKNVSSPDEESRPGVTPPMDEALRTSYIEVQSQNDKLQDIVTTLHQKHHSTMEAHAVLKDTQTAVETENAELKNKVEDMLYDVEKTRNENDKLKRQLEEVLPKLKSFEHTMKSTDGAESENIVKGFSLSKLDDMREDLEEQRELAANRLQELEKMQKDYETILKHVENLKMELKTLPDGIIMESPQYQCLQSQFSVLYNECMQIKTQLNEERALNQSNRIHHLKQIEQMESQELEVQKKLRNENMQLEDQLAIIRREYEMLRIEFEQTLCAQEQTGPMNREMRHIITSLQAKNQQVMGENGRYRHRLKEAMNEIKKLKNEVDSLKQLRYLKTEPVSTGDEGGSSSLSSHTGNSHQHVKEKVRDAPPDAKVKRESDVGFVKKESDQEEGEVADEDDKMKRLSQIPGHSGVKKEIAIAKQREDNKKQQQQAHEMSRQSSKPDSEIIRDLQQQLKKAQGDQKEMKLLLDMYRSAPKEQRDKAQMMAAERKAKQECEELRAQMRKIKDQKDLAVKKLHDEDHNRRVHDLEIKIKDLQATVTSMKGEEEILLDELDKTGHALDQVQEQNNRLLEQLREKDECNFKLMSERIKSNQVHQLLTEEKEIVVLQNSALKTEISKLSDVVRTLEEKEKIMLGNMNLLEKELSLRQQALEMHKRKAIEYAQSTQDLQLHLNKYQTQWKEAQSIIAEKTSAVHQESFKYKRIQEELNSLKRKLERAKKIELAGSADEILVEEIKEYKEQLTCPSCKCKRKDAVLTKCFHVFCFECIKTRYETRQRKCPKCNAGFGANDFHRIYLG